MGSGGLDDINSLHEAFLYVGCHLTDSKKERWNSSSPMMRVINYVIPKILNEYLNRLVADPSRYHIKSSSGSSGKWSNTPYIAILDKQISFTGVSVSPSRGVFPTYLISIDGSEIYLCFMTGIGTKKEKELKRIVEELRFRLDTCYSIAVKDMKLGDDPHLYSSAVIFFKKYDVLNIPSELDLMEDLSNFMKVMDYYSSNIYERASRNDKYCMQQEHCP